METLAQATPVNEQVALQAAQWFLLLRSGEATERQRAQCSRWREADPAHEVAWQRAERVNATFGMLPGPLAVPLLDRVQAHQGRRHAIKGLAVLLMGAPAGWLAWCSAPALEWRAEHRTAKGERLTLRLSDGTLVELNTASAVDLAYDRAQRLVLLRGGEVLITTAPDPAGQRPFLVGTSRGRLRALGTRFVVRRDDGHDHLTVFEGAVEVRPDDAAGQPVIVQAGQQARFTADAVEPPMAASPYADWWARGVLRADDMRLGDFTAELARYRPGVLRCDPAVADLRISGVFQLRDTDPVILSLPKALPVKVIYRTRYWVTLVAADAVNRP